MKARGSVGWTTRKWVKKPLGLVLIRHQHEACPEVKPIHTPPEKVESQGMPKINQAGNQQRSVVDDAISLCIIPYTVAGICAKLLRHGRRITAERRIAAGG